MRINPYVYPFVPFEDLSKKTIRQNFIGEKRISLEELKKVLNQLKKPKPKIKGRNKAEKILFLFQDKSIRFGPKKYILENKDFWIRKLNHFISQNLPIQFTILGFPFKIPVPLKTNRTKPDMGEVLSLARLKMISDYIKSIWEPGAIINIFTEGVFGRFSGVPEKEWVAYREFLKKLIEMFDFGSCLRVIELSEMEKEISNFKEYYRKKVNELKTLYQKKDPNFLAKYQEAYPSIFHIVSSRMYPEDILMDVYNPELKDEELLEKAREVRQEIQKKAQKAVFHYYAYLKIRDEINYLEKTIPGYLPLTVSPKPNRLGIIPVNEKCQRLPYHSVTVFYPKKNIFLLEYLIDIKRSNLNYQLIYFDQDQEDKPFYYLVSH